MLRFYQSDFPLLGDSDKSLTGLIDAPLGFQAGDYNLYRYVGNSPTNATDPSGLAPPALPAGKDRTVEIIKERERKFWAALIRELEKNQKELADLLKVLTLSIDSNKAPGTIEHLQGSYFFLTGEKGHRRIQLSPEAILTIRTAINETIRLHNDYLESCDSGIKWLAYRNQLSDTLLLINRAIVDNHVEHEVRRYKSAAEWAAKNPKLYPSENDFIAFFRWWSDNLWWTPIAGQVAGATISIKDGSSGNAGDIVFAMAMALGFPGRRGNPQLRELIQKVRGSQLSASDKVKMLMEGVAQIEGIDFKALRPFLNAEAVFIGKAASEGAHAGQKPVLAIMKDGRVLQGWTKPHPFGKGYDIIDVCDLK